MEIVRNIMSEGFASLTLKKDKCELSVLCQKVDKKLLISPRENNAQR